VLSPQATRCDPRHFPAEQARIVRLLVDRIDVAVDGLDIRLNIAGLAHLAGELTGSEPESLEAT
jgi:hypothetical protein